MAEIDPYKGMTVEELLAAISGKQPERVLPALTGAPAPQPQVPFADEPSMAADVARGVGRGAVKGAVGMIPRTGALVEDAFWAIPRVAEQLATGKNDYLGPQWNRSTRVNNALDNLADMGINRPETAVGRYSETGTDFVTGTLTGVGAARSMTGLAQQANPSSWTQRAGAELIRQNASNPGLQAIGSLGAGAAAQALDENGVTNPFMRLLAPMAAGIVTGGVASGGRNVYDRANVGRALDTPEGLRRAAGTMMRDIATNPDSAAGRLARNTGYVPGVTPTGPSASRDFGLMGAAQQLENYAGGREVARQAGNAQARTQFIQNKLGLQPGADSKFLKAMDDAVAAKQRIMEGSKPVDVNSFMDDVRKMDVPDEKQKAAVTAAKNLVLDSLQQKVEPITERRVIGQQPVPKYDRNGRLIGSEMKDIYEDVAVSNQARPGQLLALKQDISDALTSSEPSAQKYVGARNARRELTQVLSQVDDLIEQGAPGYKTEFRDPYSAAKTGTDRLAYLRDIIDKSAAAGPDAAGNIQLSPPKFLDQMRASRVEKRRPDAGRMTLDGLAPDQRIALNRLYMDMAQENLMNQRGVRSSGSSTMKNMTFDEKIKALAENAESPILKALPAAIPLVTAGASSLTGAGVIPSMIAAGAAVGGRDFLKNRINAATTRRADALRATLGDMYVNPDALRQGLDLAKTAPVRQAEPVQFVPGLLGSSVQTISDATEEKKKKKRAN